MLSSILESISLSPKPDQAREMDLRGRQSQGFHIVSSSGSSQAPLLPTNENGSEQSTPNSANSVPFNSFPPNKSLQAHNSHLASPDVGPRTPSTHSATATSIFFPPLPARSSKSNKPQMSLDLNENLAPRNGNRSPRIDDVSARFEPERRSEIPHSINSSPNQSRFAANQLNSPISLSAKPSFPGFFRYSPILPSVEHPSRRVFDPTIKEGDSISPNQNNWSQGEDSYHLYHEPIEPDEQDENITSSTSTANVRSHANKTLPPLRTPKSADSVAPNLPPYVHNRTSIGNLTNLTNRSPTMERHESANERHSNSVINFNSESRQRKPISFCVEQADSRRPSDVSADIYFCYVTLKSNERANHRSRSYHGPKNPESQIQARQSLYAKDATKNLSSSSVVDLPMSPAALTSMMVPVHFRDHCVRELIETESNYVHALEMIITSFAKPLEPLLRREDSQLIFGHIKHFHHIHTSFQADLVKAAFKSYARDMADLPSPSRNLSCDMRAVNLDSQSSSNPASPTLASARAASNVSSNSPPAQQCSSSQTIMTLPSPNKSSNGTSAKISSCFLNMKDKFLRYGEYCATLSKAQALVDELSSKNEAIASQLDRCQQDANEGKFKLRDLLSLPMQRILKYHLLLAQLIKNTSPGSDDYIGLKRAHEAMVDLGQYINEVKRDTEMIQIINEIEQSVVGLNMPPNTQLTDYGRLVTDGSLRIRAPHDVRPRVAVEPRIKLPHDNKLKQKRYVFVFDKVMLVCKLSGVRGHQYKEALVLSDFELEVNPNLGQFESMNKHATKDKWNLGFNLVRTSDRQTYTFFAKSQEMKNKWVEAIQKAMDNIRPAIYRNHETNHEFLMHSFDKASSCDHCGKLLHGLYYQGYRCRNCFVSVHKKCLASVRPCGASIGKSSSAQPRARGIACNQQPSSPSYCSDDANNATTNPLTALAGPPEMATRIEYSNIDRNNPSGTVDREAGTRPLQRPVCSMINVSASGRSSQQRWPLKCSNSTPSISLPANLRARAISDFAGDEKLAQLEIMRDDMLLVTRRSLDEGSPAADQVDRSIAPMGSLNSPSELAWWFGRNLRSGREGRFPSNVVELLGDETDLLIDTASNTKENAASNVNFVLGKFPWFCGRMERDKAQSLLEGLPHGTYLVRVSPKHNGSYVISLNYNSQIKHMRIYVSKDNQLYLSQNRYFKSVVELVTWYERNSLVESFHMLDARLTLPFKSVSANRESL